MAKRDIEPKTVWTCDRCDDTVEMRRTEALPMYWRRWSKCSEHNVQLDEKHLCPKCNSVIDAAMTL